MERPPGRCPRLGRSDYRFGPAGMRIAATVRGGIHMSRISTLIVLVGVAFMTSSTVAFAAGPTPADFEACNRMAQSKVSNPSASPASQPRVGASSRSSAAEPQAAPSQETAGQARVANQADQLHGIADTSKDDPIYQRAYRDCMKGRGF